MWGWHEGINGADWVWMTLMMGLVWAPIVLIVLWFLRDGLGGRSADRSGPGNDEARLSALELAQRAYARGDLSRERYREVVEDLEPTKGAPHGA